MAFLSTATRGRFVFAPAMFLCVVAAIMIAGCTAAPIQQQSTGLELGAADYGKVPENPEALIRTYLKSTLVDPRSLIDLQVGPPKRAYTAQDTDFFSKGQYGYAVLVSYNAKNRMGGYQGRQDMVAFIKDDRVVFLQTRYVIQFGALAVVE